MLTAYTTPGPRDAGNWDARRTLKPDLTSGPAKSRIIGYATDALSKLAQKEPKGSLTHQTSPHEIEALCIALMSGDGSICCNLRLADDRSRLFTDLTAAARLLGDWWVQDRATFADVTAGSDSIFQILRDLGETQVELGAPQRMPVIFAPVPGEQHTLGVRMAAEMFRMDGWEITLKIGYDQDALVSYIEQLPRCIVGLSIGGEHALSALEHLFKALRRSCPQASIVVCGQDIEALRPNLRSMNMSDIGTDIDEAKITIASIWDRERRLADLNRQILGF